MHIKDIKNKLKVLKKRAQGSIGTAIKVLTATVLGASILVGGYALTTEVVLPNTTEKVESMFAYSEDAAGGAGGSGTVEPSPDAPQVGDVRTFLINFEYDYYFDALNSLSDAENTYEYHCPFCNNLDINSSDIDYSIEFQYEYGMTFADWCQSSYSTYRQGDIAVNYVELGHEKNEDNDWIMCGVGGAQLRNADGQIAHEDDLIDETTIYYACA